MKVRAIENGCYGGHYREKAYTDSDGVFHEGEVFEIDATPFPRKDENGNPIQKMEPTGEISKVTGQLVMRPVWLMKNGELKKDAQGQPIPVYAMATAFSPTWMEPVNEDATITYPEKSEPMGVLPMFQEKIANQGKVVAAKAADLPENIKALLAEREKSPI